MGKITESGKYGPVTRGEVDSVTVGEDKFTLENDSDLFNFQVGDKIQALDSSGNAITPHADDDLEIESINVGGKEIIVKNIEGTVDYAGAEYIQKADGSSKAE